MVICVILQHAAGTYSGMGNWYYVENTTIGFGSTVFFGAFITFTQAYFMSLLFMIAGYFVPPALRRKGAMGFIKDRLVRLGIPTLFFIVVLHPLSTKLAHPDLAVSGFYRHGIESLDILSWTGPLWFAEALLVFSVVYAIIVKLFAKRRTSVDFAVTGRNVWLLIAVITGMAFSVRTDFSDRNIRPEPATVLFFRVYRHVRDRRHRLPLQTAR